MFLSGFATQYQQTVHTSITSGFNDKTQYLYQQHGVLSQGPKNFSAAVSCTSSSCIFPTVQLGYYPEKWRLDFGYLARFHSTTLAKSQPFFGLAFQRPNELACKPLLPKAWQPWIGIRAHQHSQLSIADATQVLYLGQVDPAFYTFARNTLPHGSYPITVSFDTPQGEVIQVQQFVDTPLKSLPKHASLSFNIGWPTDKVPKTSFGLPPLSNKPHQLTAFATYTTPWYLGMLTSHFGLSDGRFQLGLRDILTFSSITFAPEFLWQPHAVSDSSESIPIAIGSQIAWLPSPQAASQISFYGYPHNNDSKNFPTIVHFQATQHNPNWQTYLTAHWSENLSDRYWQTKVHTPLGIHQHWAITFSVLSDFYYKQGAHHTLRIQAKPRTQSIQKMTLQLQNQLQQISLAYRSNKPISLKNQLSFSRDSKNASPRFSATWSSAFQNPLFSSSWVTRTSSQSSHKLHWTLKLESGFSYTDGMIFWHRLPSPWQSYRIRIPQDNRDRWFWWENTDCTLPQIRFQSHPAYKPLPNLTGDLDLPLMLYPGNLTLL